MDKNFNPQRIESIKPKEFHFGGFELSEITKDLGLDITKEKNKNDAETLLGFILKENHTEEEISAVFNVIINSSFVFPHTKEMAQNCFNEQKNKPFSPTNNIEQQKQQLFIDKLKALAHDSFLDILALYYTKHGIHMLAEDEEVSKELLDKYPRFIKEIRFNNPSEIKVGSMTLKEAMEEAEKKIEDPGVLFSTKLLFNFISGPEIIDTFGNRRQDRIDFINVVTNKSDNTARNFFKSNKFKFASLSQIINTLLYPDDMSPELINKMELLHEKIVLEKSGDGRLGYREMEQKDKEEIKNEVTALTIQIFEDIMSKYVRE